MQPRFLDSADPTKALFSGVGELEAHGQYLYVTDQYNYRVRRVDLVTGAVSTVLGSGSSVGWSTNTNALLATCGRFAGLGASPDGLYLYVAMQNSNMVGVVRNVGTPRASFNYVCGLNPQDPQATTQQGAAQQQCIQFSSGSNTNPCMILQPSDVVVASPTLLYVTYFQGITQLDLSTSPPTCQQVAGLANDLSVAQKLGLRDGIMVSTSTVGTMITPAHTIGEINTLQSTLLNYPYRLSFSLYRGSIYVADYFNQAVRRFYVQPQCACAEVRSSLRYGTPFVTPP